MAPHIQIIFESILYMIAGIVAGMLLRLFFGRKLSKWEQKIETPIDDQIAFTMRKYLLWLCVLLGVWFAVRNMEQIHVDWVSKTETAFFVILVICFVLLLAKILSRLYELLSIRHPGLVQTNSLMKGIVSIVVGLCGLMVILNRFGISIAPAIAAVGVGGIAVALALQDTLGNLFAGLYILLAKRIRIDDFIRLEGGQEGIVHDITWRHTTIRQTNNNFIIVPNIKMAQAIVVNFTVLNPHTNVSIALSFRYGTDIDLVDRIAKEVVENLKPVTPGMQQDFQTVFRLHPGFGPSSLDCTLIVGITSYEMTANVADTVRRTLLKRFTDEGIAFPLPRMEVTMQEHG